MRIRTEIDFSDKVTIVLPFENRAMSIVRRYVQLLQKAPEVYNFSGTSSTLAVTVEMVAPRTL